MLSLRRTCAQLCKVLQKQGYVVYAACRKTSPALSELGLEKVLEGACERPMLKCCLYGTVLPQYGESRHALHRCGHMCAWGPQAPSARPGRPEGVRLAGNEVAGEARGLRMRG